jgi:hypothetical protein
VARDEDWLWPSLPASELTPEVVLGLADDAVPDDALAAAASASGDAAGAAEAASGGDRHGHALLSELRGAPAARYGGLAGPASVSARLAQRKGLRQARLQLVLTAFPQVVPFATRVGLFTSLRALDREAHHARSGGGGGGGFGNRVRFTVRRASIVADAFRAFKRMSRGAPPSASAAAAAAEDDGYSGGAGSSFKDPFMITFINREGLPEAGIDGGGVFKEFLDSVIREAFSPTYALFKETPHDRAVYPNPASRYMDMGAVVAAAQARAAAAGADVGVGGGTGAAVAGSGGRYNGGSGGGGGSAAAMATDVYDVGDDEGEGGEDGDEYTDDGEGEEDEEAGELTSAWRRFERRMRGVVGGASSAGGSATRAGASGGAGAGTGTVLEYYEFLGQLLGKALYEGILVEPRFAGFFLRKLLGRANQLDDLASLDPEVHRSLLGLKRLPAGVGYEDLGLSFEATEEIPVPGAAAAAGAGGAATASSSSAATGAVGSGGGAAASSDGAPATMVVAVPLVPGGGEVPVTAANVSRYIYLAAHYRLNVQIAEQCAAFLRGFRRVIPLSWMRMFQPPELQTLISGAAEKPVDLVDLRTHTAYAAPLHDRHPYVEAFWRVLGSFSEEDKRAFLHFVTSVSRPPLLGFGALQPRFGIQPVRIASDADKLPSAATCMSLLKLPFPYSSDAVLRDKLLTAIRSGAGFELT